MKGSKIEILAIAFIGMLLLNGNAEARAGIDVIVNAANNFSPDPDKIKNIFLGKVRQFSEGAPAKPTDLPEGNPLRTMFYSALLGKSDMDMKLYWSTTIFTGAGIPPKTTDDEENVLKYVQENKNGIGYVRAGMKKPGVKVILSLD